MDHSETFTHHGRMFVIEADGWPTREAANAAVIDLQLWALQFGAADTAALYDALDKEREALVHETAYDPATTPLPAVREAQRHAVKTGLQGQNVGAMEPTVSIEAYQVFDAPGDGGA